MPQAVPVQERPVMEATNPRSKPKPSIDVASSWGVRQRIQIFEELYPNLENTYEKLVLDNPHLFE
jgi:hypothetical protein